MATKEETLTMEVKAFYDYQNPEEALKVFLEAHDNLEDHIREKVLKRFLIKNLPSIKDKEVLDVGAGGGIWTEFWLHEGARVTALDKHSPILLANKSRNPGAKFIEADATTVEIRKKFDIIFAKDLIEHLKDDETFLKNMADHLKEDGYLFLETQNSLSLNYFVEGGYNFLHGNIGWCGYDPTHLRFYNFRRLGRKLRQVGLKPTRWWSAYHFPYRFLSRKILKRLIEWKGFHLIELLHLDDKFHFKYTGWAIGVIAKKEEGELHR